MARRSRSRNRRTRRVPSQNANRPRLQLFAVTPRSSLIFTELEDRRSYHPDRVTFPKTTSGNQAHLIATPGRSNQPRRPSRSLGVSFDSPQRVLVCVRRKIRREVIFAIGKNRGRRRRPRYNRFSKIGC